MRVFRIGSRLSLMHDNQRVPGFNNEKPIDVIAFSNSYNNWVRRLRDASGQDFRTYVADGSKDVVLAIAPPRATPTGKSRNYLHTTNYSQGRNPNRRFHRLK